MQTYSSNQLFNLTAYSLLHYLMCVIYSFMWHCALTGYFIRLLASTGLEPFLSLNMVNLK